MLAPAGRLAYAVVAKARVAGARLGDGRVREPHGRREHDPEREETDDALLGERLEIEVVRPGNGALVERDPRRQHERPGVRVLERAERVWSLAEPRGVAEH